MAAWGVEARVPFLDREFLDVAMTIEPGRQDDGARRAWRSTSCARPSRTCSPPRSLWRQKEQFSDGVGYSWIDSLKAHAEHEVSDRQMAAARHRFPYNPPETKEAYLYRQIFEEHFPRRPRRPACPAAPRSPAPRPRRSPGTPACGELADPSGRAVRSVHKAAY